MYELSFNNYKLLPFLLCIAVSAVVKIKTLYHHKPATSNQQPATTYLYI